MQTGSQHAWSYILDLLPKMTNKLNDLSENEYGNQRLTMAERI